MKTFFPRKTADGSSGRLLIFFNGWSCDESLVKDLRAPEETDVLEVHDYTVLAAPEWEELIEPYREFRLCAWSLGVFAAARFFAGKEMKFTDAFAINGTPSPVGEYGIPPQVFDGTARNWENQAAREKFFFRMAGSREAASEMPKPDRTPEDQKSELLALRALAERPAENIFTRALAGASDRIFPPEAQKNYWSLRADVKFTEAALPHNPFRGLRDWEEVLNLDRAR